MSCACIYFVFLYICMNCICPSGEKKCESVKKKKKKITFILAKCIYPYDCKVFHKFVEQT